MIFRRMSASLRAQNWTGVAIELAMVIVGVFIGIQAANWNLQRNERNEIGVLLAQLDGELRGTVASLHRLDDYYATTRKYSATADAGWRGDPSVTDKEFVIAAYQASQVTAVGTNSAVWAEMWGAQDLRRIEDLSVRRNLARIMTFDYGTVDRDSVSTPYREQVRKVIPDEIQNAIREHCGDRPAFENTGYILPAECDIDLPDRMIAATAAALRAKPDLQGELRWHRAAVANQLLNVENLESLMRSVTTRK